LGIAGPAIRHHGISLGEASMVNSLTLQRFTGHDTPVVGGQVCDHFDPPMLKTTHIGCCWIIYQLDVGMHNTSEPAHCCTLEAGRLSCPCADRSTDAVSTTAWTP
jgi:hypothetical protein